MAHPLTTQQVDQLAAEQAAFDTARIDELAADEAAAPGPDYPVLEPGAEGPDVTRLVNLLAVLGYRTNDVINNKGAAPVYDATVEADVEAAQTALVVSEPGVAGTVGAATWGALYEAASAKLEAGGAAG